MARIHQWQCDGSNAPPGWNGAGGEGGLCGSASGTNECIPPPRTPLRREAVAYLWRPPCDTLYSTGRHLLITMHFKSKYIKNASKRIECTRTALQHRAVQRRTARYIRAQQAVPRHRIRAGPHTCQRPSQRCTVLAEHALAPLCALLPTPRPYGCQFRARCTCSARGTRDAAV